MTTKEIFDLLVAKYPGMKIEVGHRMELGGTDYHHATVDGIFVSSTPPEKTAEEMLKTLERKMPTKRKVLFIKRRKNTQ